jgi:ubiquinone/menaquinone biosynthesis C-methylase UbiE
MNAQLQLRIQRYGWDRAADDYEPAWAAQIRPAQECLLDMAALAPGERVLDVACGTGLVSCEAARLVGPGGLVLGTDISQAMVQAAEKEAASHGLANARFRRQDACAPVTGDRFDAALCSLGLMYVPDPVAALQTMRSALRRGGRAVAAVWGARARCGWAEIFPIIDARVQSDVCPMFFRLGTHDALARAFDAAGFEAVTTRRLSVLLPYSSDPEVLRAAFAGGPVALAYSRFDAATRASAEAEYLASIQRFRVGEGYLIPGEFVVARGDSGRPS